MAKKIMNFLIRYKIWLLVCGMLFLVIIPLLINYAFKISAPFELFVAEWEASDVLAFYGSILASVVTIIGVYWSISYAQNNYREDERNRVRPYFALTHLKKRSKSNILSSSNRTKKEGMDEPEEKDCEDEYNEYRPDSIYIIINRNSIDYKYELTQTQKDILATGGVRLEEVSPGMLTLTSMDYISMPFEIENVGSGAALCFQIGFYLENDEKKGIHCFTIKPNSSLYIHIFASTVEDKLDKDYCLEFVYRDIIGTMYSQKYPVRFERDKKNCRINHQIDLTGTQEVCSEVN